MTKINWKGLSKSMYYDMDGKPIDDVLAWAKMFENKNRLIKQEYILGKLVFLSSVWLGIDHSFTFAGKPLIFETMGFCQLCNEEFIMDRYSTKKETIEGHKKIKKGIIKLFIEHLINKHLLRR